MTSDVVPWGRARFAWLPRPVLLLGWISLFTDTASEAIYPLLPLFLTAALGARPFTLGLIEGVAEATSALLKIAVGRLSDRQARRRPWVIAGYAVSSLVRPTIAIVSAWWHVLLLRFADRVGKGVRSAPRDALLAQWAPPDARGRVFSFHRAMDHTGAVIGPLLASLFLFAFPGAYRPLFALTLVPGLVVLAFLFRLPRDEPEPRAPTAVSAPALQTAGKDASERLPPALYRALAVFGFFTLGNSTDAYLLLRIGQVTGVPAVVPLAWAGLHVIKASTSLLGGWLADHAGRRLAIAAGWLVYAGVYLVFAWSREPAIVLSALLAYGLFFGLTEGAEKALITDWTPRPLRGTAFGLYNGVVGLGALAASVVFGIAWEAVGPSAAFGLGAGVALIATLLLPLVGPPPAANDRLLY